jgi:hypothetical protein
MMYAFKMTGYLHAKFHEDIGTGIQAMQRFCLSSLLGCNGVTEGKN